MKKKNTSRKKNISKSKKKGVLQSVNDDKKIYGAKFEKYKKILLEKKKELLESINIQTSKNISEKDVGDEIDDVVQTVEKELAFDISSAEKNIVQEIEIALKKIENGTFGMCELCRKPIEEKRLEIIPYTRYCISCQKKLDSKLY